MLSVFRVRSFRGCREAEKGVCAKESQGSVTQQPTVLLSNGSHLSKDTVIPTRVTGRPKGEEGKAGSMLVGVSA